MRSVSLTQNGKVPSDNARFPLSLLRSLALTTALLASVSVADEHDMTMGSSKKLSWLFLVYQFLDCSC